jgi:RHS repeat-associated protein
MFRIRKEHMEAMGRGWRERLRQKQIKAFQDQGLKVEDDAKTGKISLTDAAGGTATITPHPKGMAVTSGEDRKYWFEYDSNRLLTGITDPADFHVGLEYDDQGRLVAVHRGEENTYRFEYNPFSHLSAIHFPDNKIQRFTHDNYGRITSITDRNGHETLYEYSIAGLLTRHIDRKSNQTRFEYEEFDAASVVLFANGDRHEFEYDARGFLDKVNVNGTDHAAFHVDEEAGSYDAAYTDGSRVHFLIKYDRIVEAENETCTVKLEYDDNGRLVREDTNGKIVEYLHNELGALVGLITPDGEKLLFERDREGRVCGIIDWSGDRYAIEYDPCGALMGIKYPNGVSVLQEVTPMGLTQSLRVTSPASPETPIISCSYEYDPCDRLIKATEKRRVKTYSYDGEGRLTDVGASESLHSEHFELDPNGNRIKDTHGTCRYNAIDQLEEHAGHLFQYDGMGNMIKGHCPKGDIRCQYNGRNQLIGITTRTGQACYSYDPFGRRVRKECNGRVTRYIWAGEQLISEITTNGKEQTRRDYLFFPEKPVPLAMRNNGRVYYIHPGRLSEPLCMTDKRGEVVWQAEYSAFGEARITIQAVLQPWRLAGQYYDNETGLHYVLARYYNPQLGRYLTKDPLFVEGGSDNFYIYCDGDPVNRVDPKGELIFCAIIVGAVIGAAIAGGIEAYRQKKAIDRGEQEGYEGWSIVKKAAIGGAIGAVGGGVGAAIGGALTATTAVSMAGAGFLEGSGASIAEQCAEAALTGEALSPLEVTKQALTDGVIGAGIGLATAGVGGWLARRAKKGAQAVAKKVAEEEAKKVVKAAKKGYRAVSDAELDDIVEHGFRPHPEGKSMEAKWFSETQEGAEEYTKIFTNQKNIVEAEVPQSVYDKSFKHPNIDNTGPGFAVPAEELPNVKPIIK